MKKVLSVFAFCAIGAMAADFTGTIIDEKCSTKKEMLGNAACAAKCFKDGEAAVLVTDEGKIYKIADKDKVVAHGGHKVTISGTLDGDTIKVDSVKM